MHKGMENLINPNQRTKEELQAMGSKGGKKSGENRRKRKMLKEAIKELLEEKTPEGVTKQDIIVAKCLANLENKGEMKDLKILSELLGENVIKMEVSTPKIVVENDEAKEMVADLFGSNEVYEDLP